MQTFDKFHPYLPFPQITCPTDPFYTLYIVGDFVKSLRVLTVKLIFLNRPTNLAICVTVHHDKFLKIKPTRCTSFSNLFLE
jgi:hypothetical protein